MLIAVVPVKDTISAKKQIAEIQDQVDGVELRLDYCPDLDLEAIRDIKQSVSLPMIFTYRKSSQGGQSHLAEEKRLDILYALCELQPEFLDLESEVSRSFVQKIKQSFPRIKLMCSYHDFKQTPKDLLSVLNDMQQPEYDYYKIACFANNTLDALSMLHFIKVGSQNIKITGISMGEDGQCARILGNIMGNAMHYVACQANAETAPGQLTLDEFKNRYHIHQHNQTTAIYALLGDPVKQSVGHIMHNQAIRMLAQNAVYLKLRVSPEMLPLVFASSQNLGFKGFSVTMPLKEAIIPLLDDLDGEAKTIQAVNTVFYAEGKWMGCNTDSLGAIYAIQERVSIAGQHCIILGAGGAARAIAYGALKHQASVTIVNRTVEKAAKVAQDLGCDFIEFKQISANKKLKKAFIINTLPYHEHSMAFMHEILKDHFSNEETLIFDINYQDNQNHLQSLDRPILFIGKSMYIQQALLQISKWFNPSATQLHQIESNMQNCFSQHIQ